MSFSSAVAAMLLLFQSKVGKILRVKSRGPFLAVAAAKFKNISSHYIKEQAGRAGADGK
jgi:hypothetical protein